MEVINPDNTIPLRKDNQLLLITHLSQLLTYVTGFGGLLVPIIIWAVNKDKIEGLDQHGKEIINFQLSMILFALICIPLILVLGLGILGLIILGIISFVFPIVNGINASNGNFSKYPFTIRFLQ
ncbi:MAG: DUF4870 domain-containing protein [Flavobacteriaceae bacterium]|nr:DUF4870 domain-containing protein [Flavobacteriaceae bacterium]